MQGNARPARKVGMGAMLADTPPSQPGATLVVVAPIFMGEGGAKGDHCVITHISSKQSEAVH